MTFARFPGKTQIWHVLGVIVFIHFSWSIGRMFYFMPIWLKFMNSWEILPSVAYVLAFALLESLLVLGLLLVLAFAFPARFFRDRFVPQGSMMVLIFTISSLVFHKLTFLAYDWTRREIVFNVTLIVALLIVTTVLISNRLVHHLPAIERFFTSLAERMMIFLYLYIPLGIISIIVIFIRNIR